MNTNNVDNSTKYHVSDNALSDINLLLQGKYDTSQNVKLRDYTPKSLVDIGLNDLPMLMNSNHVLSNILTEQDAKKIGKYNSQSNYHGLGVKKFLETIDSLDNLEKVFKHKNGKDYIILTTQYDSNGDKIITPIYVEDRGQYNHIEIDTNKVKSIYGKQNLNQYLKTKLKNNNLEIVYDNKKRTNITSGQSANDISSSEQNISQNQNNVKHSISEDLSQEYWFQHRPNGVSYAYDLNSSVGEAIYTNPEWYGNIKEASVVESLKQIKERINNL